LVAFEIRRFELEVLGFVKEFWSLFPELLRRVTLRLGAVFELLLLTVLVLLCVLLSPEEILA
jgi:hypothetical protein